MSSPRQVLQGKLEKKRGRKGSTQSQAQLSHSEPKPQQSPVSGGRAREGCAEPKYGVVRGSDVAQDSEGDACPT